MSPKWNAQIVRGAMRRSDCFTCQKTGGGEYQRKRCSEEITARMSRRTAGVSRVEQATVIPIYSSGGGRN